ncbi:MAG: hypothetical protein AAF081_16790 [Actinomycetota bacterium]
MSLDPARRAGLERARAAAIARDHFDLDAELDSVSVDAAPFGVVVASSDDPPSGGRAVVVSSGEELSVLGGVLVWLDRNEVASADFVTEHHAGVHARRAALLAPDLCVHGLESGRVASASPASIAAPQPTADDIAPLVAMIERSGAQAVIEDGIVRAEVAGLEVGRVVDGPAGSVLEVGVGRFDREAGVLLYADRPVEPTLVDTIEQVRGHRSPGAPLHAVNRIGRERWLREVVRRSPESAGVTDVELIEPIPPRTSLLEPTAAALLGHDGAASVLVVCSVGVELGLIPATADLVARHTPDEVRFVLPARDRLPYLERLVARLRVPVSFADVEVPWADGPPG